MRGPSVLDLSRWQAVGKARELVEQQGGSTHGVTASDAVCALLIWIEDHPEHPAQAWCRNTSQRQRKLFERDWKRLTGR